MVQKLYSVENEIDTFEMGLWRYGILALSILILLVIGGSLYFFLTDQASWSLWVTALVAVPIVWLQIGGGVCSVENEPRHAGNISYKIPFSKKAGTLDMKTALLGGSSPLRPWEIVSYVNTTVTTSEVKDVVYTAKDGRRVRMTISFSMYTSNPPKSLSVANPEKIVENVIKTEIGKAVKLSDAANIVSDSQTLIADVIRKALWVDDANQDPKQAEIEDAAKTIRAINIAGEVEFEDPDAQEEVETSKKYKAAKTIYGDLYPDRMNPDGSFKKYVSKDFDKIMMELNLESGKITKRVDDVNFAGLHQGSNVFYGQGTGAGTFGQAGGGNKPNPKQQKGGNQPRKKTGARKRSGNNTQPPNNP